MGGLAGGGGAAVLAHRGRRRTTGVVGPGPVQRLRRATAASPKPSCCWPSPSALCCPHRGGRGGLAAPAPPGRRRPRPSPAWPQAQPCPLPCGSRAWPCCASPPASARTPPAALALRGLALLLRPRLRRPAHRRQHLDRSGQLLRGDGLRGDRRPRPRPVRRARRLAPAHGGGAGGHRCRVPGRRLRRPDATAVHGLGGATSPPSACSRCWRSASPCWPGSGPRALRRRWHEPGAQTRLLASLVACGGVLVYLWSVSASAGITPDRAVGPAARPAVAPAHGARRGRRPRAGHRGPVTPARATKARPGGVDPAACLALLAAQSAYLVFAGVGLNSYSSRPVPAGRSVSLLKHLVGDDLVALDGPNTGDVTQWTGTGIYPEVNAGYGIRELAIHDPVLPPSYLRTWPVAGGHDNDRLGDNVFVPSVGSARRARFYGAQFILASPGRRPKGAVLVARIPVALVKYVFLYRVPGAAQFSFDPGGGARGLAEPSPRTGWRLVRAGTEGLGPDGAGDLSAGLARPGRRALPARSRGRRPVRRGDRPGRHPHHRRALLARVGSAPASPWPSRRWSWSCSPRSPKRRGAVKGAPGPVVRAEQVHTGQWWRRLAIRVRRWFFPIRGASTGP